MEVEMRKPEEIVGREAVEAIAREGWTIVALDSYTRWVAEVEESRERCRRVARAATKAAGTRGILLELEIVDGTTRIVVCAPGEGDAGEERILRRLALLLTASNPEAVIRLPRPAPAPSAGPGEG